MKSLFSIAILILLLSSCNKTDKIGNTVDLLHGIASFTSDSLVNVVIEIPAGTCLKTEYDKTENKFSVEKLSDGTPRIVQFLPYPGNYGFIPSTEMSRMSGGDGDALDVLVLAESFAKGNVIEVIPIALLKLEDDEELDYKIIAVPKEPKLQIIKCPTYDCLQEKYPAVISIIQLWFTHYKGTNKVEVSGWEDERSAMKEIIKWKK